LRQSKDLNQIQLDRTQDAVDGVKEETRQLQHRLNDLRSESPHPISLDN
jgi:hypothetical protein